MRWTFPLPLFAALTLLAGCSSAPQMAARQAHDAPAASFAAEIAPPPLDPDRLERALHRRVNAVRASSGLSPLAWSDDLRAVARHHSRDMILRGFFSHQSPGGLNVTDRARRSGLECALPTDDRRTARGFGENLFLLHRYASYRRVYRKGEPASARREYTWRSFDEVVETVIDGWMQSAGHRANLLRPRFRSEGLGVVLGSDRRIFVTQVFC